METQQLSYLNAEWKRATVYTAFLQPKTQQDAIRLIYGLKPTPGKRLPHINRPVQWVTDTGEKLMEQGYLIKMDQKLRGS